DVLRHCLLHRLDDRVGRQGLDVVAILLADHCVLHRWLSFCVGWLAPTNIARGSAKAAPRFRTLLPLGPVPNREVPATAYVAQGALRNARRCSVLFPLPFGYYAPPPDVAGIPPRDPALQSQHIAEWLGR